MKYNLLLFILIVSLTGSGCNVINPAEVTPTYIRIDSVRVKPDALNSFGTVNHKISSVWVYFDNAPMGVYHLPANIPITAEKPGTVQIAPGINISGLSNEGMYPFLTFDTLNIDPKPGEVIRYTPTVAYTASTKIPWKEDFERGSSFVNADDTRAGDTTIMHITDADKVFEGGGGGYISVNTKDSISESISNVSFPIAQGDAYLEINYKCNTSFQVGLIAQKGSEIYPEYFAGVKAKEEWNKLYIDLSKFTLKTQGTTYRLMIKSGLEVGMTNGYVLLDNLKVVCY